MCLRAGCFRLLGAAVEGETFAFRFVGGFAAAEGPSLLVVFFSPFFAPFCPPFLGMSASAIIAYILGVKGRNPEAVSFLYPSKIFLDPGTSRNIASRIEPTKENFEESKMIIPVV